MYDLGFDLICLSWKHHLSIQANFCIDKLVALELNLDFAIALWELLYTEVHSHMRATMTESDMPSYLHAAFHRHGIAISMPASSIVPHTETVHRTVRLRLLPETQAKAQQLAGTAGACRWVWNHFLARQEHQWRCWQDYKIGPKPTVACFALYKDFTALRRDTPWLQQYRCAEVRHTRKHLADAYRRFWAGQGGHPRCKAKHQTVDGFTVADCVSIRQGRLRVPKIGRLPLKGANPYAQCPSVQARIRKEGTVTQPKWYVYVVYAVPVTQVKPGAAEGALGLDRNVGQCTDSTGTVHRLTDTARLEAKIKRHQRGWARKQKGSCRRRRIAGQLTRLQRKRKRSRDHDTHHISLRLADTAHTVVIENLQTQAMTQSARGTVDNPGRNVRAKSGLNRSILNSSWGQLERKLAYKCRQVVKVPAAYTSQACSRCGCTDQQNRPTQARFQCVACQFQINADHNAALNILGRRVRPVARGTGASARRGAWLLGPPTTREQDMPKSVCFGI